MKKTESNNLAEKVAIIARLRESDELSSIDKNQKQDQEKTQETNYRDFINSMQGPIEPDEGLIENAQIVEKSNISEQMDEILKNNDKFETVKVLMVILCKELGIPEDSQFPTIAGALNKVWEAYYKSMEEWKLIAKSGQKTSIRQ